MWRELFQVGEERRVSVEFAMDDTNFLEDAEYPGLRDRTITVSAHYTT